MSEFTAIDLTGIAPQGICAKCATLGIQHGPTQALIVHCTHSLRGAYRVRDLPWKVLAGFEASIFVDVVLHGLTLGELRTSVAGDIAEILQEQAQQSTKH